MNMTALIGNIGADPQKMETRGSTTLANFRIATSRPKYDREGQSMKDNDGRTMYDTDWHTITCFGAVAKSVLKICIKGQKVGVHGHISNNNYTDAKGVKHYGYEIVADGVEFLSRGRVQEGEDHGASGNGPDVDQDEGGDVPF